MPRVHRSDPDLHGDAGAPMARHTVSLRRERLGDAEELMDLTDTEQQEVAAWCWLSTPGKLRESPNGQGLPPKLTRLGYTAHVCVCVCVCVCSAGRRMRTRLIVTPEFEDMATRMR